MKNLTKKQKLTFSILIGWTITHLILLYLSDGRIKYLWPFDVDANLNADYDFTEFIIYGILPWVVFIIYKSLNKEVK